MTDPMDRIEIDNALQNVATMSRDFYQALLEGGFTPAEALSLTERWLASTIAGSLRAT